MFNIPLQDLHQFHKIDRSLFSRLVLQLSRNPGDAVLAMAFWLWLERNLFPCMITRLLKAPDFVVNKAAEEAIICINSLAPDQPMPRLVDSSFTTTIMGRSFPLDMIHRDKSSTINGIKKLLNDVCARVFTDILDQAIGGNTEFHHSINVPGFPHQILGNVTFLKFPPDEVFPVSSDIWGFNVRSYRTG